VWRWHATYYWKALDEAYNFFLNPIVIRGLHTKLWGPKVTRVPTLKFSRLPFGSPGDKMPFGCGPRGEAYNIL
jgi:hypothetical protein